MRIGDKHRLIDVRTSFLVLHASFPFQTKRRRFRAGDQPREAAVGQEEEGRHAEEARAEDDEGYVTQVASPSLCRLTRELLVKLQALKVLHS